MNCGGGNVTPETPTLTAREANPNARRLYEKVGDDIFNISKIPMPGAPYKLISCRSFVFLNITVASTQIGDILANAMEARISHYPLYISGLNATYAWVDQVRKEAADMQRKKAEKQELPKF